MHPLDNTKNQDVLRGTALRILGLILNAPRGQMPSVQELADAVGIQVYAVWGHLRRLHVARLISRGGWKEARTVRPTCRFVPVEEFFPED